MGRGPDEQPILFGEFKLKIDQNNLVTAEWKKVGDQQPLSESGNVSDEDDVIDRIKAGIRNLETFPGMWTLENLKNLGRDLFKAIFPKDVAELFVYACSAVSEEHHVSLTLDVDERSRVSTWPLEYLYCKACGFLAAAEHISLSRNVPLHIGANRNNSLLRPKETTFNVLLVVSNPGKDQEVISAPVETCLYEWVKKLSNINDSEDKQIEVRVLGNLSDDEKEQVKEDYHFQLMGDYATYEALIKCLKDYQPDLLHFIGHGRFVNGKGELGLAPRDPKNPFDWYTADQLYLALENAKDTLRLVVLQSCQGADTGWGIGYKSLADEIVQKGIPAVVAMQYKVTNESATSFAKAFYEALQDNPRLDLAVTEGRRNMLRAATGREDEEKKSLNFVMPVLFAVKSDMLLIDMKKMPRQDPLPSSPGNSSNNALGWIISTIETIECYKNTPTMLRYASNSMRKAQQAVQSSGYGKMLGPYLNDAQTAFDQRNWDEALENLVNAKNMLTVILNPGITQTSIRETAGTGVKEDAWASAKNRTRGTTCPLTPPRIMSPSPEEIKAVLQGSGQANAGEQKGSTSGVFQERMQPTEQFVPGGLQPAASSRLAAKENLITKITGRLIRGSLPKG
jgi:hypothetical protein